MGKILMTNEVFNKHLTMLYVIKQWRYIHAIIAYGYVYP